MFRGPVDREFIYFCLSSDVKRTTSIEPYSILYETDTGKKYYFDGSSWKEDLSSESDGNIDIVLYDDDPVFYVCKAPIGSALASAVWQITKLNTASGLVKQWCDGDALYNNTATDLATVKGHTYSF